MMRILVLLALAVLAFANDPAPEIKLPLVPEAAPDDGKEREDRLVVSLTKDGRIVFRGKIVNLDQLSSALRTAKRDHHLRQAKKGTSGEVDVAPGVRASALYVLLRADGSAPWRHVQWIQTILAEQKFVRFQFAAVRNAKGDTGKIDAPLPAPNSLGGAPKQAPIELVVGVEVVADKERPAPWGPEGDSTEVKLATGVAYRVGAVETRDIAVAKKLLTQLCQLAKQRRPKPDLVTCDIRATDKVPCGRVVELTAFFRAQGMERIHFSGTAIPAADLRRLDHLPYPTRNKLPQSDAGGALEEPEQEVEEPR